MLVCVGLHSIIPKSSPSAPPYCLLWSLGLCGFFYFSDHWPQQESWESVSQTLDCLPLKSVLLITVLDCSTGKELFMNCQVAAGYADKDYISQPPLQLFMALWLNSSQWDVRRSDIYNFLLVPSKGRDVSSTSSAPSPLAEWAAAFLDHDEEDSCWYGREIQCEEPSLHGATAIALDHLSSDCYQEEK